MNISSSYIGIGKGRVILEKPVRQDARRGCISSRNLLVEAHRDMPGRIAVSLGMECDPHLNDLVQDGALTMVERTPELNPNRKYTTSMSGEVGETLKRSQAMYAEQADRAEVDILHQKNMDPEEQLLMKETTLRREINISRLSLIEQFVVRELMEGKTVMDIAKILGTTDSRIYRFIDKAKKKFKSEVIINTKGLVIFTKDISMEEARRLLSYVWKYKVSLRTILKLGNHMDEAVKEICALLERYKMKEPCVEGSEPRELSLQLSATSRINRKLARDIARQFDDPLRLMSMLEKIHAAKYFVPHDELMVMGMIELGMKVFLVS